VYRRSATGAEASRAPRRATGLRGSNARTALQPGGLDWLAVSAEAAQQPGGSASRAQSGQPGSAQASAEREAVMLSDLAALTPPLVVAAAFLIAAGAFVRHEMRRGKSRAEHEEADDSHHDSPASSERNNVDHRRTSRSYSDDRTDRDRDPDR